jgi:hypothetical protein
LSEQIKDDEKGGICSAWERREMHTKKKERDHLDDLDVEGKIITE